MKNPLLCHVILFGQPFFKMILALKSRKLFDTREAKKKKRVLENTDIGIKRD